MKAGDVVCNVFILPSTIKIWNELAKELPRFKKKDHDFADLNDIVIDSAGTDFELGSRYLAFHGVLEERKNNKNKSVYVITEKGKSMFGFYCLERE